MSAILFPLPALRFLRLALQIQLMGFGFQLPVPDFTFLLSGEMVSLEPPDTGIKQKPGKGENQKQYDV